MAAATSCSASIHLEETKKPTNALLINELIIIIAFLEEAFPLLSIISSNIINYSCWLIYNSRRITLVSLQLWLHLRQNMMQSNNINVDYWRFIIDSTLNTIYSCNIIKNSCCLIEYSSCYIEHSCQYSKTNIFLPLLSG